MKIKDIENKFKAIIKINSLELSKEFKTKEDCKFWFDYMAKTQLTNTPDKTVIEEIKNGD